MARAEEFMIPRGWINPSQRMMALARADGVNASNKAAYDRWYAKRGREVLGLRKLKP